MKSRSKQPVRHVVLYAEDEDVDLLLCERAFKVHEKEIELRSVSDGRSVVDWLEGSGPYANRAFFPIPALVVLDSKLKDMSGLDVLRWVRAQRRFRDLPVVLHAGSTPRHELGAYDELHVTAVIEKDSTCQNLVECVRNILDGELVGR
jgi:CheY-like chemotaxis protein